jgi:hydroxymethylglutaryl-CoA reductase
LMMIAAAAGLANNFGAVKSLVTKGIQVGHMKMHLFNILNFYAATQEEKQKAVEYFKNHKVSFKSVTDFINQHRSHVLGLKS